MKENPKKVKLVQDWLAFAKENMLYAKGGMKEEFSPYHTVCFLCQSSAEKYLKAYLISKGWSLEKVHDLADLVNVSSDYDKDFADLLPNAKILNQYITEGRYPGDLPFESIGEAEAKEAIEAAEKIETFVLAKLEPPYTSSGEESDI